MIASPGFNATLKEFMVGAYGVQSNMIFGGPKWQDSDRFDIIAKAPDPTDLRLMVMRPILLLRCRFDSQAIAARFELPPRFLTA